MKELTMYPGDNGQQEFFEDVDSNLAIIRNHGDRDRWEGTEHRDKGWWCHGNHPYQARFPKVQGTLNDVIRKLEKDHEIKVTTDLSKIWIHPRKGAKNMVLVDSKEHPRKPCPRCSSMTTWYWHPKGRQEAVKCEHCGYIGFAIPRLDVVK